LEGLRGSGFRRNGGRGPRGFSNLRAETVSREERTRDLRTDVVVAGSGMGGLTSALRAAQAGARVILLEKAALPRRYHARVGGRRLDLRAV